MSSIKDKLKSKIKSRIQQPETMESFDQNSVNVTLSQGKTQLTQIKLQCLWNNKNNMKNPKLKCRWYNRTQNNLQEIVGVEDQIYQPSILDVGSIVEITCEPQLPGITYEGMPIQLKSTPISLAIETENQATHLVAQGKARFFIELKEAKLKGKNISHGSQSMIKIDGYKMVLCQMKFGQLNDDVLKQVIIDQLYPQFIINRRISRELMIKFNQQESCTVNFKNHDVRDVFCLVNKLTIAKLNLKKASQVVVQKPAPIFDKTPTKSKQIEKSVPSLQKIQRKKSEQVVFHQKQEIKTEVIINNPVSMPPTSQQPISKASTADLLQLSNLKQQIKQLQVSNAKLLKDLEAEKQRAFNLENKISQTNERLQNATKNYFQLQNQLKNSKQQLSNFKKSVQEKLNIDNSKNEELLYYKNQAKLLSTEKTKLEQLNEEFSKKNKQLNEEVQNYRKIFNTSEQQKSFSELEDQMKHLKQMNNELKLKYEYSIEQKDKIEQDLKSSRNMIEQIEAEKKYIQKKYESLTNEISSPSMAMSKISDNKSNGQSSLSNSYVFDQIPTLDRRQSNTSSLFPEFDHREKQILDLKKQIKDFVEENGYLRTLLSKQKKNSSKTQLKLELFEVKKLVNRLSEAMIEKDMCINNLKQINKELNKKNTELVNACNTIKNSV